VGIVDLGSNTARLVVFDKRGQGLSDPTIEAPTVEERSEDIGAVMAYTGMLHELHKVFPEGVRSARREPTLLRA